MISVEDFINHEGLPKKRKSKLEPYKADIEKLKKAGYTEDSILKFLAMNGVTVGKTTLHLFIKRHIEIQPNLKENLKAKVSSPKKINQDETKKISGVEQDKTDLVAISPTSTFDWQTPINPKEYY